MDKVVEIIEPAVGIIDRPLVQLGLHPSYPQPGPIGVGPQITGIHQRLRPLQFLNYLNPLGCFAMWTAFPPPDYYQPSAPSRAVGGRRAFPPHRTWRVH
ncbi:hypothetical protein GCM10018966_007870 [Streptomyces yanii]